MNTTGLASSDKKRVHKTKPMSMTETKLNKIVNDTVLNSNKLLNKTNSNNSMTEMTNETLNTIQSTGHSKYTQKVKASLYTPSKGTKASTSSLNKSNKNLLNTTSGSFKALNSNRSNIHKEIPHPKLRKTPSNGLDTLSGLNADTSMSSLGSNVNLRTISDNKAISPASRYRSDTLKLNEEILHLKLSNSKLTNEINILQEKLKTMKNVLNIKNSESEMIKTRYTEIIEEYRRELEKSKKLNLEFTLAKEKKSNQSNHLKTTLNILIEVSELFLNFKPNARSSHSINIESISMDIYESFIGDEERRMTMIEQIQGLLISKLNAIKKSLSLDLDKEIERVKGWTYLPGLSNLTGQSGLNLSYLKKQNEESKLNLSNYSNSNDIFDLSVSQQFYAMSPKFNNIDLTKYSNKNRKEDERNEKEDDCQILNDSFLNELKRSKLVCI